MTPSKPLTPTERLVAFADRIEAGKSPSEAAGLEWEMLVADIRSLDATQAVEPTETERGIARHAIVQANIHLANGDLLAVHEDHKVALDALAARSSSAPAELAQRLYEVSAELDDWPALSVEHADALAARLTSSPENPAPDDAEMTARIEQGLV